MMVRNGTSSWDRRGSGCECVGAAPTIRNTARALARRLGDGSGGGERRRPAQLARTALGHRGERMLPARRPAPALGPQACGPRRQPTGDDPFLAWEAAALEDRGDEEE